MLAAMAVIVIGFFVGARYGMLVGGEGRVIEIAFFAPSASSVAVVGDFNEWDPLADRMERRGDEGVWRVKMKLRPGAYEYGFLIDGRDWKKDPGAEESLADGYGGENSILFVEG
jgi:1,4-alpha-glucan branching enzyme